MDRRAKSVTELLNASFEAMPFEGQWQRSLGNPEKTGSWIIWGDSANGKTRCALQLCKYLSQFGRVAYNSLEEGASLSMREAFLQVGMMEAGRRVMLLDKEPVQALFTRLEKHKSPDIVFIDSVQYTGLKYVDYVRLLDRFRKKLFVFVSHADGKLPAGRVAKSIRYDANIKIRVEGYTAFPVSRYGGGEPLVVWDEGAVNYWGTN